MRTRHATLHKSTMFTRVTMIALAAIIAFVMPIAASAQVIQGESFVTETGDHTIAWNENWVAELSGEDDFSTMLMLEGQIMIFAVMFMHDPDLGLSEKAVYHSLSGVLVSSFESTPTQSVEWVGDDGSYRGAHVIELSGIDFVLYLRVDAGTETSGPTMQFAAAPTRAFPVSLEAMQQELTIDGEPVLDGDDGQDVLDKLELGTSTDSETEATDSTGEASEPNALVERERPSTSNTGSKSARDAHLPSTAAPVREYVSPSTGFTVSWSESWTDMATTESTVGEFSLLDDTGRVVVSFTGRATTETNRAAYFDDIVARESRYPGFIGSSVADDRLLIATWTADNELAVLEYVFVNDSTVVTIMVTVTSGDPARYVDNIQTIELDGVPILQDWNEIWDNRED